MAIRLVGEVLDHAPVELTPAARLLLVVLAECAREDTRRCWPGMDVLMRRTGLSERHVRRVLAELAQRGYEVRVPFGVDKHGAPVFARKGHRTEYLLPDFHQRRTPTAALKEDLHGPLSDPKADIPGTQRRTSTVAKEDAHVPPFLQEPSEEPSNPGDRRTIADLNAIRAVLAEAGSKRTDDQWCHAVIKKATESGTVKSDLTGFVKACILKEPGKYIHYGDCGAPKYVRPAATDLSESED